jgi:hypothetical protein
MSVENQMLSSDGHDGLQPAQFGDGAQDPMHVRRPLTMLARAACPGLADAHAAKLRRSPAVGAWMREANR